ncbi:hypothetical protein Droror1_Dr00012784 [Drosera rotundifolia]
MACNNSACQSGCYKYNDEDESQYQNQYVASNGKPPPLICVKCKVSEAVAGGSGGGDDGRFCGECFRGSLFGKFRFAVTSEGMISATDKVLVAFSGGAASRVALQFVHDMQYKAQKNFDASKDKLLPVFGVGVAFVDESSFRMDSVDQITYAIKQIKSIVSYLSPPEKALHVVPIEGIYSSNINDGRERLKKLLEAVSDDTGKEDLLLHMRMLALQKAAKENGYSKLVTGSCTSRIACHVISETVKGRGYSLPADIQYVDARWNVPVLLPLRDCLGQELSALCHRDGLKTVEIVKTPSFGINALVSSFVSLLQEENPSRESTIMRTAGKLTPFDFNKLPEDDDPSSRLATNRRQRKFNLKPDESTLPESFCSLCNSPLNKSNVQSSCGSADGDPSDKIAGDCCSSCRFQILPHDPLALEHFYSLLPDPMVSQVDVESTSSHKLLRSQIQDFLLSDYED